MPPLKFNDKAKMVNQVMKKVNETDMDNKKRDIPLELIDLNPDNEYLFGYSDIDFLASEINENGFHGAIEVYAKSNGRYEIMAGHRRYLACQQNGAKTIPCIVSEETDPVKASAQLIMSNIHHRDLSPLRLARALHFYEENVLKNKNVDYTGRKRTALAAKFNMSETAVQRYLAILKYIPELQELCDVKGFPFSYFTTVAQQPEDIQRKLYNNLVQLAPDGKISELSKVMIEQQLTTILAGEQRKQEDLIRQKEEKAIGKSSSGNVEVPQKPTGKMEEPASGQTDSDFVNYENANNFGYNTFGSNSQMMAFENMDNPATVTEKEANGNAEDTPETVDNAVIYYINKIDGLTEEGAVYENKSKVIDMLSTLIEKLKK